MRQKLNTVLLAILVLANLALLAYYIETQMTRKMLDARTVFQYETIIALDSIGAYAPEQRCRMREAFPNAEYRDKPNIFENAANCEPK